jgi:glycosyltransferase involved in cell wall biosynthesis
MGRATTTARADDVASATVSSIADLRKQAPLRIAMIAPPYFDVPPKGYGGVESVVADLVDALVDRGHEVTLIGAGAPGTNAQRFIATYDRPVTSQLGEPLPEVMHAARVAAALERCDVDIVHDHTLAGPLLARGRLVPTITTVHGPVNEDAGAYYDALQDTVQLVSISAAQRAAAPHLPWVATVHNAVRTETFPFRNDKDDVALFLGRFHPDKAPHLAIDAARAAGLPIVLAGKCSEPIEREYFEREVQPRLGPDTILRGVANARAKRELLSRAKCLLFPICWEEPFGLVMIEAMACGTPVVALRRGSVPEVVTDGLTGIIVDEPAQLPDAVLRASTIEPAECRRMAETRFSVAAMAAGYEAAYATTLSRITESPRRRHADMPQLTG